MSAYAYRDLLEKALKLSRREQLKLVEEIIVGLQQNEEEPQVLNKTEEEDPFSQEVQDSPLHSIMEFEGFGKEVWEGINVEDYLNEERNSWDG